MISSRNFIISLGDIEFLDTMKLERIPNFTKQVTTSNNYNFTIMVRSFDDQNSYITIKQGDYYLCLQILVRVGYNLNYSPILTLERKQHVWFFYSSSLENHINYMDFDDVTLCYTTASYYSEV